MPIHAAGRCILFALSLAAFSPPGLAEVAARKDAVKGTANLQTIRLAGSTLFGSNDDRLSAGGKKALDQALSQLASRPATRYKITGHADRMGDRTANRELSARRAEAVRKYLLSRDGNLRLDAYGMGDSEPLVKCADSLARDALVKCLAPNRRVEIDPMFD